MGFQNWLYGSNRPYIKNHDLVKSHKYSGVDYSICYNYFYSPLCDVLLKWLPMWLAPNVITLGSFLCNLIPYLLLTFLYGSDMDGYIPPWLCATFGLSFLFYNILDNTDGK